MAADWPQLADVKAVLRIEDGGDDLFIQSNLSAAIGWVQNRCQAQWTDPDQAAFLPDPLFTVAAYEAARLTRRRDSVDGTIGWGDMGVVRVGPKDPDIETMIAPYLAIVT